MVQSSRSDERFHVKQRSGSLARELDDLCDAAGLVLPAGTSSILVEHMLLVLAANTSMNLTRIVEPRAALRLHVVDSLMALREVNSSIPGQLLDLGAGPGYPGVPLAVASERDALLVDSTAKKIAVLAGILGECGLGARIHTEAARAEQVAISRPGAFAVVVARAVSALPSLVELAAPLLMPGGTFVALKGQPSPEELERGRSAAGIVGLEEMAVRRVVLPGDERRTIVTYRGVGVSEVQLPRRTGLAQHDPLA